MILSFPILNTQPEKRNLIQLINDILFAKIDVQQYFSTSLTSFFVLQQRWPPCNSTPVTHSRFDKRLDGYHLEF